MQVEIPKGSGNYVTVDKDAWENSSQQNKVTFYRNKEKEYNEKNLNQRIEDTKKQAIKNETSTLGEKIKGVPRALLGQGLALGFGDEIEAGLRTGFGLLGDYDKTVGGIRDDIDEFRTSDPTLAYGGEIAGALLPAIASGVFTGGTGTAGVLGATATRLANPISKGIKAVSKGVDKLPGASTIASKTPNLYQGMKTGAGYGAVYGTGTAESDPNASAYQIAKDRLTGMAQGGVLGGTIGGVATPVISKGLQLGKGALESAKRMGGDTKAIERSAMQKLSDKIDKDGGVGAVQKRLDDAGSSPIAIADAGENLRGLGYASSVVSSPEKTKVAEKLIGRNNEQSSRILDLVKKSTGIGDDQIGYQFIDDLAETTKALSVPAYKEAYKTNIPAKEFKEFFTGTRAKTIFDAGKKAQEELAIDGVSVPSLNKMLNNKDSFFGSFDDILAQDMPTEFLHAIKRGLDSMIKSETKTITPTLKEVTPKGVKLIRLKEQFNSKIIKNNPSYGKANKDFADSKRLEEAFKFGQKYKTTSKNQLEKLFMDFSPSELQAWKSGMITKLDDIANNKSKSSNFLNEIDGSNKLDEIFEVLITDPKQKEAFKSILKSEQDMFRTFRKNIKTTDTAQKTEEINDLTGGVFGGDLTPSNISRTLINKGRDKLTGGTFSERARQISEKLFTTDKATQRKVLEALETTNKELKKEVEKRLNTATQLMQSTVRPSINQGE